MGTISWMRGAGPLVPFAVGFEEELRGLGHRPGAVRHHMVLMGQLDRWLTGEGLTVEDLSIALVEGFLASRRASGRRRVPTVATVARLLEYLRDRQVVPLETLATPTSRDEMLVRYRHHLIVARGLAPTTIRRYERFARRFLAGRGHRAPETTESTEVIDDVREVCLQRRENVVIEGTLQWGPLGDILMAQLSEHDYTDVHIVDIEVPASIAQEQAVRRWWEGRLRGISGHDRMGGRFTPPVAIARLYEEGPVSRCAPRHAFVVTVLPAV